MITITEKEFNEAIRNAFKAGENWGVTYSTWFTPKESDTDEKIKEAVESARERLYQQNAEQSGGDLSADPITPNSSNNP